MYKALGFSSIQILSFFLMMEIKFSTREDNWFNKTKSVTNTKTVFVLHNNRLPNKELSRKPCLRDPKHHKETECFLQVEEGKNLMHTQGGHWSSSVFIHDEDHTLGAL